MIPALAFAGFQALLTWWLPEDSLWCIVTSLLTGFGLTWAYLRFLERWDAARGPSASAPAAPPSTNREAAQ
jgi:hypothetical protein